jgi:hypothetical protein
MCVSSGRKQYRGEKDTGKILAIDATVDRGFGRALMVTQGMTSE